VFADQINAREQEDTLSVRDDLNVVATNMIRINPVFGIGLNTFVPVMRKYDTVGVTQHFAEPVHNVFLLVAAESGLVGLSLFLLLIALTVREGLKAIRTADRFLSLSAIGALSGLTVILVSNLMDVHLRTDVIYALFWLLIGLLIALRRMATTQTASQTQSAALNL
jgi:putative inorganic carbon (HCO3(-)) transporter